MMVKGGRKMNKSNSKYFSTALRMNEALISLLEKKDMEYISVKEICKKAGVNRSTFYLHYETISDLIAETTETVNNRFMTYFSESKTDVLEKLDQQELRNTCFPIFVLSETIKESIGQPSAIRPECSLTSASTICKNMFLAPF